MSAPIRDTWRYTDRAAFLERVRTGMPPTIICLASNGAIQGKEYSEHLPETVEELADSVHAAYLAGASMVHLHARDPDRLWGAARNTQTWVDLHRAIRDRCPDIIINDTTGGGVDLTMDERMACLEARPEVASLNLTPDMSRFTLKERPAPLLHPRPAMEYDDCIPFTYGLVRRFAVMMKERGIKPEIELTHSGSVQVVNYLIGEGLLEPPYWIGTVMGYQTANFATVDSVLSLLADLPDGSIWLNMGIGQTQLPMIALALLMGGHVRVGLEDNLYLRRGLKGTNADFVARAARLSQEMNRAVATPSEARAMLGLSQVPSRYP
jgi:3-keto-5-aminohexanoate cleavage enzyme